MGSKSKPGPETTTTASTQIPQWLSDTGQAAVGRAEDLSNVPYQPYTGQTVAGPNADTQQAYQQVRDMQGQTNPAFQQAQGAWGGVLGNLQSLTPGAQNAATNQLYGNYQQNVMNPAQGLLGGYLQGGPLTAQQVGSNAQALMSPYTSSVIDPANQLMHQQLQSNLNTIGAGANQAGAFGGSRQGVQEGIAQSQAALGSEQYLGNMLNTQWGNALGTGYNIGALGAGQGMQAANTLAQLGATGYQNAGATAADMLSKNLGLGTAAAGQIPQLAMQQQGAEQKDASLMQSIGAAGQQQTQAELDAARGQFYQQQDDPTQKLNILLSSLGMVPYGTSSTGVSQGASQSRNVAAGVGGGALSGAATGAALGPYGAAAGAVIGGLLGGLS